MAMARAFPVDKGSKEATFTALAASFGFNDKVKDLFLNGHMENLEDFHYYFADEDEIDAFVAIPGWSAPYLRHQTSIVKQAWTAVRQFDLFKRNHDAFSPATEIDNGLEVILKEAKVRFWRRYKLSYPVEVFPSDRLLSRCYTEIGMRLLTVYDVWEVNALHHRISAIKGSKHVSTDRSTSESGSETEPENQGVVEYLSALHTYLLALAVVGSAEVQGAPAEEAFGTDPTKFVEVPLDVLHAYHLRASHSVMLMPEASRLAWLKERDTVERTIWASQLRKGCKSLGQVIQSVMNESGYDWHARSQRSVARASPDLSPQPQRYAIPDLVPADLSPQTIASAMIGCTFNRNKMATSTITSFIIGTGSKRGLKRRQGWVARTAAAQAYANIKATKTTPGTTSSALQDDLPVPVPSPLPPARCCSAGTLRRHLIRRQKWTAKHVAAAEARAQNEAIETRPGTASQALRHEQPVSTDLITEIEDYVLRRVKEMSCKTSRLRKHQWWANRKALSKTRFRRGLRDEAETCPKLPETQSQQLGRKTTPGTQSQQLGRKTMPDAIAAPRQYGRILRTDQDKDMGAIKKAHGPIRYNGNRTAAQASSSSHHGRILLPGPNECFSADEETIRAPLVNPMTHMEKRNSDTGAEVVLHPRASVRQAGAYVKQALHQQQQGENLGSQVAYADIGNIPQQWTTDELTSSHSAGYPSLPYVPPGFYEDSWLQCHWCCKWGMSLWPPVLPAGVLPLTDIDGLGYLCDACQDLDEPPLYPNAIQRCAQSLEHVMPQSLRGNTSVLATISALVVWNEP
jgi:hypothetical protein